MRFSKVVEKKDARKAVRLMKIATQAAATDPQTGKIDIDMISTGRTSAWREMEEILNTALKELLLLVSNAICYFKISYKHLIFVCIL